MVFYSFYTTWSKEPDSLVYRTEDNFGGRSPLQVNMMMFPTKELAELDFFRLLWDEPDLRICEYFDTEKGKKKPQKEKLLIDRDERYKTLPSDFQIELNKVYCLDCLLFMKELPDKFLDYILTSPPYNAGERTSHGKNNAIYKDDESMYNLYEDKMGDDEYEKWIFSIIDEGLRVVKKHIFFNIQMLGGNKDTVCKIFGRYFHKIKDVIIWNKTIASPHIVPGIMNSAFEFIFIFSNDEPEKRKFYDANFQGNFRNVITGVNSSQNKYRHLNKATFPLYLPRTIIQKFGKPKDIWYDPFSGTGTTFHACLLEQRDFLGTEIDIEQCESTNKRIFIEESALKFEFPDPMENMSAGDGENVADTLKNIMQEYGVKSELLQPSHSSYNDKLAQQAMDELTAEEPPKINIQKDLFS